MRFRQLFKAEGYQELFQEKRPEIVFSYPDNIFNVYITNAKYPVLDFVKYAKKHEIADKLRTLLLYNYNKAGVWDIFTLEDALNNKHYIRKDYLRYATYDFRRAVEYVIGMDDEDDKNEYLKYIMSNKKFPKELLEEYDIDNVDVRLGKIADYLDRNGYTDSSDSNLYVLNNGGVIRNPNSETTLVVNVGDEYDVYISISSASKEEVWDDLVRNERLFKEIFDVSPDVLPEDFEFGGVLKFPKDIKGQTYLIGEYEDYHPYERLENCYKDILNDDLSAYIYDIDMYSGAYSDSGSYNMANKDDYERFMRILKRR